MVKKSILIEFADKRINAIDRVQDIRKAVEYASLNLYSRHNVRLQQPMISDNDKVVVEIWIPDDVASNFTVGKHLRGVSRYMIKYCNTDYSKYLVGNRLLTYIEVPDLKLNNKDVYKEDVLDVVKEFVCLLKREDEEAKKAINRIKIILNDFK